MAPEPKIKSSYSLLVFISVQYDLFLLVTKTIIFFKPNICRVCVVLFLGDGSELNFYRK